MITKLRQLYNSADRFFDRRTIREEIRSIRQMEGAAQPVTVRQALRQVLPAARRFDRRARLKAIVAPQGIDLDGKSAQWEFSFDLPGRQAQLTAAWQLPWEATVDGYRPPRLELHLRPFPPPDSHLRRLVQQGHLLYRQLGGLWRQEMKRRPDLPGDFRDTDVVLADLRGQGLDPAQDEFSLSTGADPDGRLCWRAQTRRKTYFAAFEHS